MRGNTKRIGAYPENPAHAAKFGDTTASRGQHPGTGDTVGQRQASGSTVPPLPFGRSLSVPADGLCLHAVIEGLGISMDDVRPLYGDVIGSPRDYRSAKHGLIFTLEGVQRLAAHLKVDVQIHEEGKPIPAQSVPPLAPEHEHYWWEDMS